jgi:lactoylglutathione lyase
MKKILVSLLLFFCCTNMFSQKPIFNHLAIYVTDLDKSAKFYKDVIGLDTIPNPFNDNKHVWFAIGEGNALHVIAGAASVMSHPRDNHLCFSVSSVDAFIKNLTKAGIGFTSAAGKKNEITIRPDGVKQIYFTDPDGYWIEINDAKK